MAAAQEPGPVVTDEEVQALLERAGDSRPGPAGEVRAHDLAGTQRITRGRLPTLELVHETFARGFRLSLYNLLKRDAQVTFQGVQTVKCGDYLSQLPSPACLDLVRIKSLPGQVLFAFDPGLVYQMVDAFFGGAGKNATRDPDKSLTPTEVRFAQLVLKQAFTDLALAWQPVAAVEFELIKHEQNPHFINFAAPADTLLVNRFQIELPAGGGALDFVLPSHTVEPLREVLSAGAGAGTPPPIAADAEPWARTLGAGLREAEVEVRAVLAETGLSIRDLVRLKPGDVVPIEAPRDMTLLAGDVRLYTGKFGISRGRNAIKIHASVRRPAGRR
jgi:flagellar motor switch protein FliM